MDWKIGQNIMRWAWASEQAFKYSNLKHELMEEIRPQLSQYSSEQIQEFSSQIKDLIRSGLRLDYEWEILHKPSQVSKLGLQLEQVEKRKRAIRRRIDRWFKDLTNKLTEPPESPPVDPLGPEGSEPIIPDEEQVN